MKNLMIAFSFICIAFSSMAQDSDAILDKLSKKMKGLNSFYLEFDMHTKNNSTGMDESDSGNGWVKGNKFYATLGVNTIISNGLKIWTITEETVYISDADEDDDASLNPKKMMTIWEEGFKSKYVEEKDGMHIINLYPLNPDEVDYHTITLYIDKKSNSLKKAILKTKDATVMTYSIKKLDENIEIPSSKFVFNRAKHPGKEIIED